MIVSNNYIYNIRIDINLRSEMSGLIENNLVIDYFECHNCVIRNNIYLQKNSYNWYLNIFEKENFNNIYNSIFVFGTPSDLVKYQLGNNNQFSANILNLFDPKITGTTDGKWKLIENSIANGKGSDGTDIGMFGGAAPYQLSGLPPVPVVYDIIGPDVETGRVTIKARAIR